MKAKMRVMDRSAEPLQGAVNMTFCEPHCDAIGEEMRRISSYWPVDGHLRVAAMLSVATMECIEENRKAPAYLGRVICPLCEVKRACGEEREQDWLRGAVEDVLEDAMRRSGARGPVN